MNLLKFSIGNAKLQDNEGIFDLPAGFTCGGALQCQAFANRITGKLIDGKATIFRCYASSIESRLKVVRDARWHNFDLLKKCKSRKEIRDLILGSMPNVLRYRFHTSGDFYSQDYFDAVMDVARKYPSRTFYAYTKSLNYWIRRLKTIPKNFVLTASYGGKFDDLIAKHGLKYCKVVFSEHEKEPVSGFLRRSGQVET